MVRYSNKSATRVGHKQKLHAAKRSAAVFYFFPHWSQFEFLCRNEPVFASYYFKKSKSWQLKNKAAIWMWHWIDNNRESGNDSDNG
jgi:hypothetical protein